MLTRFRSSLALAATIALGAGTAVAQFIGPAQALPYPLALTPPGDYRSTFFVTPNGDPCATAPMLAKLLGAGDSFWTGGGRYAKTGIVTGLFYTRFTEGSADDWKFYVNRGPTAFRLPLPPDVTNLSQLPTVVRFGPDLIQGTADDLPSWATIGKMPYAIAALEWARYTDQPISFQMQCTGHQGGAISADAFDLDRYIESLGKQHCMWDVSDKADPNDDNPATYEGANTTDGATYSYATPTMAPPELAASVSFPALPYQDKLKRNLQMGITQLLAIASDARYEGRIVAIAIDPEVHYPGHSHPTYPLPTIGGGTAVRPFVGDYNPVVIQAFRNHLAARYGDAGPDDDSNGDGVTFWTDFSADYLASGGFGHVHTKPLTWSDVDAPRNYPTTLATTRPPFWHEWANFRVKACDEFLEKLVGWAIEAGLPQGRVFTHQTLATGSYNDNRANWFNADWLDDWSHVEASGGMSGVSLYQPYNVVDGLNFYPNLSRRDDAWGSPEFNPFVIDPVTPTFATQAQVQTAVANTWTHGAHVLWPHYWGGLDYPVADFASAHWTRNTSTGNLTSWTSTNMQLIGGTNLQSTTATNSYIESPGLALDASQYKFVCVEMQASSLGDNAAGELRCDFRISGTSTWVPVPKADLLRKTEATGQFVLDMSANASWSGTVDGLRLYPNVGINHHCFLGSLSVVRQNFLTTELQNLLIAKKDTVRPAGLGSFAPTLPIQLADQIAPAVTAGNLVVFGTDPVAAGNYSDFGTASNFYKPTTAVGCGGVTDTTIAEPASALLGMAKTGKFRKLTLPNVANLHLSFAIGIQDGFASSDGVAFRVVLRDEDRALHELFAREWRWNSWSQRFYLDLDAWKGQDVDLAFEVRGIAKTAGDQSLWRAPRIEQVVVHALTTVVVGSGQIVPNPAADYPAGTVVALQASASPGWIFTHWSTSGTLADIAAPTSASTTITMNGPHEVKAHFTALSTSTFTSIAAEDGWIQESAEGSGQGGSISASETDYAALRVGDDDADRALRTILSFDTTAIPDGATIVSATVKLVRGSQRGTPFSSLGNLNVGAVPGFFATASALELADFRNNPTGLVSPAATLTDPLVNGGISSGAFTAAGLAAVNKVGLTQLRLAFGTSDNDDLGHDTILFYSGENSTPANRPVLEIVWY